MNLLRTLLLAAGAVVAGAVSAQPYPARPITMIVPYAAGGSADVLTRLVSDRMRLTLETAVIVENITGAAGTIATTRLAKAPPDGYTIGLGTWSTHVANGAVYRLPIDLTRDFEPIGLIAHGPLVIAARPGMPPDLPSLVRWLRANPDKASQGTNGAGSVMHLAGVLFQQVSRTRIQFVPYRGSAPAVRDLQAGRIDLYLGFPADVMELASSGRLIAYAVTAPARLVTAPGIPSVDEAGLPGLHVSGWFALWAPKGTSPAVVQRLNEALNEALNHTVTSHRVTADLRLELPHLDQRSPERLRAYQLDEIAKWWPLIDASGIKVE